ncbi:UNVERIFIED_ORG: pimeloyl-ACP methyl ester carboxylesterase [Xanthobacter viscosus]|uniref:Alpha/beta hydrolase n=1 Tax=Xanthobacter autotrophicus TaxID=280 RepID=A0A6C1KBA7_XANAU|nr:alpha/beta hydrolase [Xanthobacter autotrophicus]TLX41382.1 alpha/beta hydrolase [Xanthobacter autotrophicus]
MPGNSAAQHKVTVWNGHVQLNFQVKGSGPALVYFHPAAGMRWDPFLDELAKSHTIYAPEFPGTTSGNPYDIHKVDDLGDAVLIYEEAIRSLGLKRPAAIGQSFGGMIALEIAAAYPEIFSSLTVLDPVGLWRDEAPVVNWVAAAPNELPGLLFRHPDSEAVQAALAMPADRETAIQATAQMIWNLGATGKFVWPIPDRGLGKRLHRITAPTLIIWGDLDAVISSSYAHFLGGKIAGSRVEIIDDCGHVPQVEKCAETLSIVDKFLNRQSEPV